MIVSFQNDITHTDGTLHSAADRATESELLCVANREHKWPKPITLGRVGLRWSERDFRLRRPRRLTRLTTRGFVRNTLRLKFRGRPTALENRAGCFYSTFSAIVAQNPIGAEG
jgi:hypothetical protein